MKKITLLIACVIAITTLRAQAHQVADNEISKVV